VRQIERYAHYARPILCAPPLLRAIAILRRFLQLPSQPVTFLLLSFLPALSVQGFQRYFCCCLSVSCHMPIPRTISLRSFDCASRHRDAFSDHCAEIFIRLPGSSVHFAFSLISAAAMPAPAFSVCCVVLPPCLSPAFYDAVAQKVTRADMCKTDAHKMPSRVQSSTRWRPDPPTPRARRLDIFAC